MASPLFLTDNNTAHWSDDVVRTRNAKMVRDKMEEKSKQCKVNGTFNMRVAAMLTSTQVAGLVAIRKHLPQLCRLPHQLFVLYNQQSSYHHANVANNQRRSTTTEPEGRHPRHPGNTRSSDSSRRRRTSTELSNQVAPPKRPRTDAAQLLDRQPESDRLQQPAARQTTDMHYDVSTQSGRSRNRRRRQHRGRNQNTTEAGNSDSRPTSEPAAAQTTRSEPSAQQTTTSEPSAQQTTTSEPAAQQTGPVGSNFSKSSRRRWRRRNRAQRQQNSSE